MIHCNYLIFAIFMNAIALAIQSAIILGESIFWEWRSFFVMTRGDLCLGCEVRSPICRFRLSNETQ
ncbi:MAG: hypothetical protein EWV75_04090 [Microcystis wesenbergii Mw_QC_S_20081001_S30D]|uniref:Uncharacterized protein n=1 Tax=Microcystis wesenbergii Mw_QC_S_20081001_S30D TaxID=2486245 RepID=A0A552JW23_9CHRO|nr:hypothetical protein [Microcystis aeruginosa W11-03]NCR95347.1 hypothetical protein [Microcystis aeruginosa W11-06]TRU99946.1 MAG: hypothetical protein EWV75_04090 [Microcystis wesenbergii Mw_QC_S_20081001_S30D]TRV03040.1 MAG: hypothetical protein EWV73_05805 [Microcystis wesenbergii Mw_QC_B_20070930_S4D]